MRDIDALVPKSQEAWWETNSIEDHIGLIKRQLDRSVRDPELGSLVAKIVSNRADGQLESGERVVRAWGHDFYLPSSSDCAMKDDWCESVALWDFVVTNVRYVLDPEGYDRFVTAKWTLQHGSGDCDDMVIVLGALHRLLGFRGLRARVVSTNPEQWEHVFLMVGYPKERPREWIPFDPTVAGAYPGWQYEQIAAQQDFEL